jgi:hypothetical protein
MAEAEQVSFSAPHPAHSQEKGIRDTADYRAVVTAVAAGNTLTTRLAPARDSATDSMSRNERYRSSKIWALSNESGISVPQNERRGELASPTTLCVSGIDLSCQTAAVRSKPPPSAKLLILLRLLTLPI